MTNTNTFLKILSTLLAVALSHSLFAQDGAPAEGEELQFKARGIIQAVEQQAAPEPLETYDDGPSGGDAVADAEPEQPKVVTFDVQMINFEYASAMLTAAAKRQVDEFGMALTSDELAGVSLTIVGHTDDRGSEAYNQRLSEQRANSVANYLRDKFAVGADRLTVVGEGESMPLVAETTAEARAQNRRVEMTFVLP
jgi:OOP family OmpA-OmpF porin